MAANKEETLRIFKKMPKPAASMTDWEKGASVSAGQQRVGASGRRRRTDVDIPHAVAAGFQKFC